MARVKNKVPRNRPKTKTVKDEMIVSRSRDVFEWKDANGLYAIASVVPSTLSDSLSYLTDDAARFLSDGNSDEVCDLAWRLVEQEGIVGSVVDGITDLGVTSGSVENVTNPELELILKYWIKNVNNIHDEKESKSIENNKDQGAVNVECGVENYADTVIRNYIVSGDAVTVENWQKGIAVPGVSKKCILPTNLTVYDSRNLVFDDTLQMLGIDSISLKISTDIVDIVKQGTKHPSYNLLEQKLSPFVLEQIKKGVLEIVLPPLLTTHFKRNGNNSARGVSFLKRAFPAIAAKKRLQALDQATITGMIQRLTILILGHDNPDSPYHVPSPNRVAVLREALRKLPTQKMLLWSGPDLKAIDIGPDGKVLSFDNRFTEADDSISIALGFPRILIDGGGKASSQAYLAIAKTEAMLERIRKKIKERIDSWLRLIAIKNGYPDEYPTFRWSVMKLQDQRIVSQLIMKAYEDGLIGMHDSINFLGWDASEIIKKHIEEGEEGLFDQIPDHKVSYSSTPGREPGTTETTPRDKKTTKNKEKPKPEAMVKSDIEEVNIGLNAVLSTYQSMINEVVGNQEANISTISRGNFVAYNIALAQYVSNLFDIYVEEKDNVDNFKLLILGWLQQYLNKFQSDVLQFIYDSQYMGNQRELLANYLESQKSRVVMAVEACYKKVMLVKDVMKMQHTGSFKVAFSGNDDCKECKKLSDCVYNTEEIINLLPVHIGCNCSVKEV